MSTYTREGGRERGKGGREGGHHQLAYTPVGLMAASLAGRVSASKMEAVVVRGGVGRERGGALLVKTSSSGDFTSDGLPNEIVYDLICVLGRHGETSA